MELKIKTWLTAYKVVKLLKTEGLSITEKSLSIWKKEDKIKKNESGKVCLEEIRNLLLNPSKRKNKRKKNKLPSSNNNKSNKKNNTSIDPKISKMLREFEFQKSKGQAEKALIESKKSRLAYLKERGSLISKEFINDFVINVLSTHNERVLILPEKLVDSIISIVRTNDDSQARTKLLDKLKNEISDILESENEEIKDKLKKKSLK